MLHRAWMMGVVVVAFAGSFLYVHEETMTEIPARVLRNFSGYLGESVLPQLGRKMKYVALTFDRIKTTCL